MDADEMQRDAAQCRIFAEGGEEGIVAVGSNAFVAGALLARKARLYNDCMISRGWEVVE